MPYHGTDTTNGLATITLASVRQLRSPTVVPPVTNLNLLWHVAWFFNEPKCPRLNWSGFMQSICTGDHNPAAVIQMLPLIDLNHSDQSCIYSTIYKFCYMILSFVYYSFCTYHFKKLENQKP